MFHVISLDTFAAIIICLTFAEARLSRRLDYREVAVRAVDDAVCLKTPTIVLFHALDSFFVLAWECYTCQTAATVKRILPDARHARWNRHARQATTIPERRIPDARHALRDRNRLQTEAIVKRILPDACHNRTDFYFQWTLYPGWFVFCSASLRHQSCGHQRRTVHSPFYQIVAFSSVGELDMSLRFHRWF